MQKYLEAGKVVTTHGVRGEMKLELCGMPIPARCTAW